MAISNLYGAMCTAGTEPPSACVRACARALVCVVVLLCECAPILAESLIFLTNFCSLWQVAYPLGLNLGGGFLNFAVADFGSQSGPSTWNQVCVRTVQHLILTMLFHFLNRPELFSCSLTLSLSPCRFHSLRL